MNERFAIVEDINGVVEFRPGNGSLFEVRRFQHFREVHNGRRKISTGGKGAPKGLASAWLDHPQARRYRMLGMWMPGSEPAGALNLFTGIPSTLPKEELQ